VQGAIAGVVNLAAVVGPSLGGWSFGYFTSPAAPFLLPGAPFLVGAVLNLLALGLVTRALSTGAAGNPAPDERAAPDPGPAESPTAYS
jgi:DHA1 family tetracycline resistance protein-like MFS transporter